MGWPHWEICLSSRKSDSTRFDFPNALPARFYLYAFQIYADSPGIQILPPSAALWASLPKFSTAVLLQQLTMFWNRWHVSVNGSWNLYFSSIAS
jgi:hypothetical protein